MDLPKNTPPLDFETLYRRRGKTAPMWYSVFDLGLEGVIDPAIAPPIGFVQSENRARIGGRFFPIAKQLNAGSAILVYDHEDHFVTIGTAVHELAHVKRYCQSCQRVPRNAKEAIQCGYKGDHDPTFYITVEPMYKQAGIPTYAARMIEGRYDFPEHWKSDSWR